MISVSCDKTLPACLIDQDGYIAWKGGAGRISEMRNCESTGESRRTSADAVVGAIGDAKETNA